LPYFYKNKYHKISLNIIESDEEDLEDEEGEDDFISQDLEDEDGEEEEIEDKQRK